MIKLRCNNCSKIYEFKDSHLEIECVGSDTERQMGTENEYSGTIEFGCEACKNEIIVEFNFWEYPIMTLNYSEYNEEGCVVLEEPDYKSYLTNNEEEDEYEQ